MGGRNLRPHCTCELHSDPFVLPSLLMPPLSPSPLPLCPALQPARVARAGNSIEVSVSGLDISAAPRGSVLCHADYAAPLVTRFEAQVWYRS